MALDAHLDLQKGDIIGESKNKGYEKCIQLLSWSWGVSNSGSSVTFRGSSAESSSRVPIGSDASATAVS